MSARWSKVAAEVGAAAMAQYGVSVLLARLTANAAAREERELAGLTWDQPAAAGRSATLTAAPSG